MFHKDHIDEVLDGLKEPTWKMKKASDDNSRR